MMCQLAMLYEAARESRQSSHYFLLAAKNAAHLSAHHEAVKLAGRGLEQLKSLPEDEERMMRELGLQNALGYSLFLIEGYGVQKVEQTFQRAQDLAQKTGQAEELFGILRGLCFYYGCRGQLSQWRALQGQVLDLAEQSGDPGLRILSYHLSGDLYLWLGNFVQSRDSLQKGIDLYRAERDRSLPDRFGAYDPLVGCRMFLAHDLWYLGYDIPIKLATPLKKRYAGHESSSMPIAWLHPRVTARRFTSCVGNLESHKNAHRNVSRCRASTAFHFISPMPKRFAAGRFPSRETSHGESRKSGKELKSIAELDPSSSTLLWRCS
jgi:tetratricopeptide (TPR) repeat protein